MTSRRGWLGPLGLVLVLLLTSCSQQPTPSPTPAVTPIPPIPLQAVGGVVKASGNVEPALKADQGFVMAGRLTTVAVDVGDQVSVGDLLAALDSAAAEAAVVQAQAARQAARAHLAELQVGPRPQEIEVARARLEAAQVRAKAAPRAEDIAVAEAGLAAAEAGLTEAQATLASAQANLNKLLSGPTQTELELARQEVDRAKDQLWASQAERDGVKGNKANPSYLVDAAEASVLQAEVEVRVAELKYEQVKAGVRQEDIAAARAQVLQGQGRVAAAQAQVARAQAELELARAGPRPEDVAVAKTQVRSAQAELDLLTASARPEEIAAAEAAVAEAEAALQRARADRANTELRAAFAGTVTARHANPGEMVQPSQPVLTLADLSGLRVETTDLSERDVARVAVGQLANVYVEALGAEISGRVVRIAPQANVVGGDVVYTAVIKLDEQPADLRWGMSAEVDIGAE
jgi:HlyD family secretion protein